VLAWTDTLDGTQPDVFVQALSPKSLEPVGDRIRLDDAPAFARSPRWVGNDAASLALVWVDQPAPDQEGTTSRARWVTFDATGKPSLPRELMLTGAELTSVAMRCTAEQCRGLLVGKEKTTLAIGPFVLPRAGSGAAAVSPRAHLPRGTAQDVALEAPDDAHFYFFRDRQSGTVGLIRRLEVGW